MKSKAKRNNNRPASFREKCRGPYILTDSPDDYCNNKRTVDIRIDRIEYEKPILTHEQCMRYTGQYRTVHSIADSFNGNLKMVLGID